MSGIATTLHRRTAVGFAQGALLTSRVSTKVASTATSSRVQVSEGFQIRAEYVAIRIQIRIQERMSQESSLGDQFIVL